MMKKKFLVFCILSMILLMSLNGIGIKNASGKAEIEKDENSLPVMWADNDFLARYENDYNNEEAAFIDPDLDYEIQATSDYSILDLLYYIPEERTQGGCSNCWAWPST